MYVYNTYIMHIQYNKTIKENTYNHTAVSKSKRSSTVQKGPALLILHVTVNHSPFVECHI